MTYNPHHTGVEMGAGGRRESDYFIDVRSPPTLSLSLPSVCKHLSTIKLPKSAHLQNLNQHCKTGDFPSPTTLHNWLRHSTTSRISTCHWPPFVKSVCVRQPRSQSCIVTLLFIILARRESSKKILPVLHNHKFAPTLPV